MNEHNELQTTPYEQLDFTNDFMFCKIMENNKELCIELVSLILGRRVKEVFYIHPQETIKITSDGKGVRLDVYFEDDDDSVYDLEMQSTTEPQLPKRSRYYQGMIDLSTIEAGNSYKKLKKSFVIFICLENPFDGILHKYTFENRCIENPNLPLGDDATKVIITPDGTANDISTEMQQFLNFLIGKAPESELTKKLHHEVEIARSKEKWRLEYMTLFMRDQENFEKGKEEGLKEGKAEGQRLNSISLILSFLNDLNPVPSSFEKLLADKDCETLQELVKVAAKATSIEEFMKKL